VAERVIRGFLDEVRAGGAIVVQPGAAELVRDVAAAGLPFALVSASVRSIMDVITERLAAAGVPAFPVTVAGDEVDRGKPDPTPYLRAAALLGAAIERAVVLEDSVNGVQAGWAAGATVVAVEGMVRHEPRPRVVVRQSLVGLDVAALRALVDGHR
jgi:HAD superfamily hydrolase (TIGR01509 family)